MARQWGDGHSLFSLPLFNLITEVRIVLSRLAETHDSCMNGNTDERGNQQEGLSGRRRLVIDFKDHGI